MRGGVLTSTTKNRTDAISIARSHLTESARVKHEAAERCLESIRTAAELIADTFAAGGKLLLCGNGGSAADCQHMAAEFVSRLNKDFERPGLPAIALTTDTSFLTAFVNDYGVDNLFSRQVQALGKSGDALIGITTSGKSPNVILALGIARTMNMQTILLTGCNAKPAVQPDVLIAVPSENTQYIQETHLAIEHILCEIVERTLFDKQA